MVKLMRAFGKLIETLIEIGKIIDSKPFTQSDEEPYVCHLQMSFTILLLILIYDPVTHHYARTSRPKVFCKKKGVLINFTKFTRKHL